MKLPWSRKPMPCVARLGDFSVGQKVRHKATGISAVIVRLWTSDEYGDHRATVSTGWYEEEEFTTTLAEIEPRQSAAVCAKCGETV